MDIKKLFEKIGRKKLIIIGSCLIVILGLGSVALVLFFQNKNKEKTSSQPVPGLPATQLPVPGNVAPGESGSTGSSPSTKPSASNGNNESDGSNVSGESGESNASGGSSSTPSSNIFGSIDSNPIDDIENSLALVFTDSANDYTNPGEGFPPGGVYSYAPIDQRQTYMGVRNGRLYIKWNLGGNIPSGQESLEGNTIKSVTYNMAIDTDNNTGSGWLGSETHLQLTITYGDDGKIWVTPWFRANYLDAGGHEGNFETTGGGILHSSNGGMGENYFLISYSLSELLGTVNLGQNVNFNFWSEAESNFWPHFSFDQYQWAPWNVREI